MQSSSSTPSLGEGFGSGASDGMPTPTATPIGGRSVASPAMIRILLTPAHAKVTPEEFEMMAGAIRRVESIRLADLPKSSSRGESVTAASALGKMGEVHLSFITSYDPSHSFLAPFNLHRQVLGVLGLSTFNTQTSLEEVEHSPAALRQLHPSAVIHRVFAFDLGASRPQTVDLSSLKSSAEEMGQESSGPGASASQTSGPSARTGFSGRGTSGLIIFPAVRKDQRDVRFYLKTLLPDFVSALLDGLDTIVNGLQGKVLETPRETLDGSVTSPAALSPTPSKVIGAAGLAVGSAASRASALFSSFSAEEKKSNQRSSKANQSIASSGPLGAGRYAKMKADYYLLVGDLWNALHTYDSCMSLLGKERAIAGGQDAVWYASALEGWAVARFLVARMGGGVEEKAPCLSLPLGGAKEKEKSETPPFQGKVWSDIAEAYSQALAIYTKCLAPTSFLLDSGKSLTPDTPRDYTHPLIHTSACLAYSRLLLAIWASGGWNGETFDQLLYGGVPPALAETTRPTLAVYTQHSTASDVQRSDIAAPASLSMTNSSTNGLKLLDQINIFSSLAAIFGALGFARKEAYAIRRLQALVVSLIASGIMLEKKESSVTSQMIRLPGGELQAFGTMTTMVSSLGAGENADSVLVLALQICQTYGIDVQRMPLTGLDKTHILSRAAVDVQSGKRLSSPLLNRGRASWGYNMSPIQPSDWQRYAAEEQEADNGQPPPFGWVQQQILILKDTLSVCEMLQDDHSLLFFAAILLRSFWPFLTPNEQAKLRDGIEKVQASLRSKGQETLLQYWGPPHVLDDIQVLHQQEEMQQRSIREVTEQKDDKCAAWEKGGNRRAATASSPASVLIDGEETVVSVTLSNPLGIPLEIESIRLDVVRASSVGPRFEAAEARMLVLPPNSTQTMCLSGTPHGEGKLLLRGVILKLPACVEKTCAWERTDGSNMTALIKWQSDWEDRWTRTKQFGLDARNSELSKPSRTKSRPDDRFVTLQVVAQVPRLLVQGTPSVRNGNLILFDGESRVITLTLDNRGTLDADYVHFEFENDLQGEVLGLLAEGHLGPVDVYELEYDLLNRPFMSMEGGADAKRIVRAKERKTFAFRVRGKLDVRQACIRVYYGNLSKARELGRDHFWIRDAEFPINIRVLPVIVVDGLEVRAAEGESSSDKVVLGVRVHNLHPSKVSVDWQLSIPDVETFHRSIPAGSTTHIYFTVPRLSLSDDYLKQPIPNLIERQFIVSKIQQTEAESQLVKGSFWTRSALIDMIQLHRWREDKTGASGEIGLAGLQFDDKASLSRIRRDPIVVQTRFDAAPVTKNKFVNLLTTVTNASEWPIQSSYRLVARVHERLMNHVQCTNGHLHGRLPDWPLVPGQKSEIDVGLCFLTSGTFAFTLFILDDGERTLVEKNVEVVVL